MKTVIDFATQHWIVSIIAAIAAVIIIIGVVIPMIFKLLGMLKKNKETVAIKQDLMIWQRLSGLARGGDTADRAKREIVGGQIALLRESFRNGLKMLKEHRVGKYDIPWYISVGEPSCGKSLLMTCSDVVMTPSEIEKQDARGETKSLPLRFWLGTQSVVLDVGGKAFFDRWFGGGSAEWNEIIKLVKSHHSKMPLSGIILTIPADSLIADDEELCKKKASIIAAELQKLMSSISMHLPCYVIISKMDVVTGFCDYFEGIDEAMRHRCFGWDNSKSSEGYDTSDFAAFWNSTVELLRKGRNMLLLAKSAQSEHKDERLDSAANIFMFPEAFDSLNANLDRYLKRIFGMRKIHGLNSLSLSGVYFTSSRDGGVTYNANFAKQKGVPVDDAPLTVGRKKAISHFVTNTLAYGVFHYTPEARLTSGAILRRRMPYYIASVCLMSMALFWGTSALIYSVDNGVYTAFDKDIEYFNELADRFDNKLLVYSPLLSIDAQGKSVTLFDEPMSDDTSMTRLDFYLKTRNDVVIENIAPLGFKLSSLLVYGSTDIEHARKQALSNQIQTNMAYLPLVYAVEKNFVLTENEPMTLQKRKAFIELFKIALFQERTAGKKVNSNFLYEATTMGSFLAYLFPKLTLEMRVSLAAFNPKYDTNAKITNTAIIFDSKYAQAVTAAIQSMARGWANMTNYQQSMYYLMIKFVEYSGEMDEVLAQFSIFKPSKQDVQNLTALAADVEKWKTLYNEERRMFDMIKESQQRASAFYAAENNSRNSILTPAAFFLLLKNAHAEYIELLDEDMAYIEEYGKQVVKNSESYSTFTERIESVHLKKIKNDAIKSINTEYNKLTKVEFAEKIQNLFKESIGAQGKIHDNSTAEPNDYLINMEVADILIKLATLPEFDMTLKTPVEFENKWRILSEETAAAKKNLEESISVYKGAPIAEIFAPIVREMLKRQSDYNKILLIDAALASFPQTSAQIIASIATMGITEDYEDIFVRAGSAYHAKATFRPEFNPEAGTAYITPFGILRSLVSQKDADGTPTYVARYLSANPRYKTLVRVFDDYSGNFVRYWGQFGDSLKPSFADYSSFHRFVSTSKAYAVNTQLYSVYDASASLLASLDDASLPLDIAEEKKSVLVLLESRRNSLSLQFSDSCSVLLTNWASLPQTATEANKVVMNMLDTEVKAALLSAPSGINGATPVPWWDALVLDGARLLKTDASLNAAKTIKQYQRQFSKFPLLADGDTLSVLSWEEMRNLKEILNDFGWITDDTQTNKGDKTAGSLPIKEPLKLLGIVKNETSIKNWGTTALNILTALSGGPKPLQWMLVIPDAATQSKLAGKYLGATPAMARFRYADVTYSFSKSSARFPTTAGQGKDLTPLKDSADIYDMVFNFYTHSTSTSPDASVSIKGAWAPIRLYLKDESVKDEEKGIYYVPLSMSDGMGVEYVFYIGVKFNKQLPEPDIWPSSFNWPEFAYIPERKNNNTVLSGTSKVFNPGLFFAGYR